MTIEYEGSLYIKLGRKYLKTEIDTARIEKLEKENKDIKDKLVQCIIRKNSYEKEITRLKESKLIVNRLLYEFFNLGTLSKEAVDKAKAFVEEL